MGQTHTVQGRATTITRNPLRITYHHTVVVSLTEVL